MTMTSADVDIKFTKDATGVHLSCKFLLYHPMSIAMQFIREKELIEYNDARLKNSEF